MQDQIITCACKLAGLPFNDDFYSTREWTSKSDFIHKTSIKALGITEAERSDTLASAISARAAEPSSSDTEVPKVSGTAVMSLQRLYYVLQDLLERKGSLGNRQFRDRSRHITINEHGFPSSSSPLLREWIEGQQKYFFKRLVQKPIDIIPAYVQFCTKDSKSSVSASIPPPLEMLLSLMNFQQARLNPDTADHRNHCRPQIFSTFEIVPRVCEVCSEPVEPDNLPKFSLHDPELYIMSHVKCYSKSCHRLQRNGRPTNGLEYRTAWALREKDLEKVLRSPDDCEGLPSHVELWCMKCKEKTVLKQSQSSGN